MTVCQHVIVILNFLNQHAKINFELKARGEDVPSFIVYLFKGYKAAADDTFKKYIQNQRDLYDQGESMDHYTLMTRALNKYKTMLEDSEWCAISPQEEQIIALSAQLKQLKDSNLKLSKVLNSRFFHKASSKGKDRVKKKTEKRSKKGKHIDDMAWKKAPPKAGSPESKSINGKIYHWCNYHNAWVEHEPEGNGPNSCCLRQKMEKEESKTMSKANINSERKLPFANALAAILDDVNLSANSE